MTAPLRVPVAEVVEGLLSLDDEASRYVARVHRLAAGDALVVFDPERAREADAAIDRVDRGVVRLRVGTPRAAAVTSRRRVTLIQAAAKGDKLDAIIRDATELGATCFVPAIADRSVARPAGSERAARFRRIAVEAARQSGRGDAPAVEAPLPLLDALDRFAPARTGGAGFCLDPGAATSFGARLRAAGGAADVVLVVGPEGGFSKAELAKAEACGFARVRLGRFVLRAETVCAAALGAIAAFDEESEPG